MASLARPSISVSRKKPTWAGHRPDVDRQDFGHRRPSTCTLWVSSGDQVSDTKHHGGIDQAVYAFAREDLDAWGEILGQPIRDGQFGENLTTSGIDVNEALMGERWRIGTVLFEVADVRIPCNDFKNWMGESDYDTKAWVKRFTAEGRPGPYLRVLEEGGSRLVTS